MATLKNVIEFLPKYIALLRFRKGYNCALKAFEAGYSLQDLEDMVFRTGRYFQVDEFEDGVLAFIKEREDKHRIAYAPPA